MVYENDQVFVTLIETRWKCYIKQLRFELSSSRYHDIVSMYLLPLLPRIWSLDGIVDLKLFTSKDHCELLIISSWESQELFEKACKSSDWKSLEEIISELSEINILKPIGHFENTYILIE